MNDDDLGKALLMIVSFCFSIGLMKLTFTTSILFSNQFSDPCISDFILHLNIKYLGAGDLRRGL